MIEGFWIVQFEGMQGGGGGVVVLLGGKVLGGDSAYTYEGSYSLKDLAVTATISVRNFLPGIPNVLGVLGDFELRLEGKVDGDVITGQAALINPPGVGIVVRLTRRGQLP